MIICTKYFHYDRFYAAKLKKKILKSASQVYKGYVALDFFKNRIVKSGSDQLTLKQICDNAIRNTQFKQTIMYNGLVFELELIKDPLHSYKVSFKRPVPAPANSLRKPELLSNLVYAH